MCDYLRGLHGESKVAWHLRLPILHHARLRQSIESVVQLHRLQTRRVIREHVFSRNLFRIKTALPFLVTVTAGPNVDHCRLPIADCEFKEHDTANTQERENR